MTSEYNMMCNVMQIFNDLRTALYTMFQFDNCDELVWCEITINNRCIVTINLYFDDEKIEIDCGDLYSCDENGMCDFTFHGKSYKFKIYDLPSNIIEFFINEYNYVLNIGDNE